MKMTNKEYGDYIRRLQPRSHLWADTLRAFLVGGLICVLGQLITELCRRYGLSTADAGTVTSVTLVFLGALLTGLGVYDDIARFAGAGTLVPITGFSNAVAAPALEAKREGLVLGVAAKMFTIAGPVIVYGLSAGALYGLIYWIAAG